MPLTLNQFLLLVLTIAAVVAVTYLVMLLSQLRKTAREGQETMAEMRALVKNLNQTTASIQEKIGDVDEILQTAKKTVGPLSEIILFATAKILRPSSKFLPFLFPLFRYGWRLIKERKQNKEAQNGE